MSVTIEQPYKIFTGLDSNPLDGGYIYIGTSGMNPETNPIAIYWDSAMTIVADQPLRTSMGFIVRNGSPANVYVAGDYSITVKTSTGILVYSTLSWTIGNDIASAISTATNKVTPIDADQFGIWDSVTGYLNHVTWANIKATLLTYFSALTGTWAISTTGTAAASTNITAVDAAADVTTWPLLAGSITGVQPPLTDAGLTYNSSTNALTTTTFIGDLTGGTVTASGIITGNYSGASNSIYGNNSAGAGAGVYGYSLSGVGVKGSSASSAGIYGFGSPVGVKGEVTTGIGVYGLSSTGYGVIAESRTTAGITAAFRIVPQDAAPTGPNQVGDIYVSTAGLLRICTVAGTPGTWTTVGTQV